MSSDRKIILHTGFHKTGTSTIQNVLYENRELLLEQEEVLYPSLAPNLTTPLRTIFRYDSRQPIANKMAGLTTEEEAVHGKNYLESLEAEVSSREWDTLLLSAEGMSNMSQAEIEKLREWGEKYASDWTVLTCVRHPIDWTRSMITQSLKSGDTLRRQYEDLPTPGFRKRISNTIAVFGRENVRVFDFDTAVGSDGGIVGTFARKASLGASSRDLLVSRVVRINESLSLEAARILDSLNRQRPMFVDNVRAPRRSGWELSYIRRIEGHKFDVPGWVKENIRSQSREDVAWLNETFGLDLYRDVMDSSPATESQEKPVETLGDETVDSIAGVIGELVTASTFERLLNQGRVALRRDNLGRAEEMFRKAARLDPDAPQPEKLLERVAERKSDSSAGAREDPSDHVSDPGIRSPRRWLRRGGR